MENIKRPNLESNSNDKSRGRCDSYQIIVVAGNLLFDGPGHVIVDFGCPTPSCTSVDDGRQNLRFHAQPGRKRPGK